MRATSAIVPVTLTLTLACGGSSKPDTDADLDAFIVSKMEVARLPGLAACIVKNGAVAWCKGYGLADVEEGRPVTADTPFLIASVTKVFTATAVLQRWEAGDFDLDDDVAAATDFPVEHPSQGASITYRQLLAHTAGIDDSDVTDEFYTVGADPSISLRDAVRGYFDPSGAYYDADANFFPDPPGTESNYSNMGYALVGYLVEARTGQDFAAYCAAEIFAPLGLERTSFRLADFDPGDLAVPYVWLADHYQNQGHYTFADYPNGGIRGTARSVARFLASQARGGELDGVRILDRATLALMWEPAFPDLDPTQGLGWAHQSFGGDDWVGHTGGEEGVHTAMFLRVRDGLGFVVLANGSVDEEGPPEMIEAADAIEARLIAFGETLE